MKFRIKSHPKLQWILKGSKEAVKSAFWGIVAFAWLELVIAEINTLILDFDISLLYLFETMVYGNIILVLIVLFGSLFSFIPAIIGGGFLAFLFQRDWVKERLSMRTGVIMGAILGGIAVISICLPVLNYEYNQIINTGHGDFSVQIPRAIIATFIGFIAGGWTGKRLVLSLIEEPSDEQGDE